MEARILRTALLVAVAILSLGAGRPHYSARSQHFIVTAQSPQLAQEVCQAAERYRRDLAIEWLGHELPPWRDICPISVKLDSGAGGATSFVFQGGMPTQWTMQIQGTRERILDSVLPHEITHTVFATHFGRPLPRWADEGGSTTVEHAAEKAKQDRLLIRFLSSNPTRGIAFNQMFAMKDYPPDILPLYSQGYSLARYFIQQGGKRRFVDYVGEGMRTNNWTATTRKFYGFSSLSELQVSWVDWVRQGSPAFPDAASLASAHSAPTQSAAGPSNVGLTQMASLTQQPRSRIPEGPQASWQTLQAQNERALSRAAEHEPVHPPLDRPPVPQHSTASRPVSDGWYAKRRDQAQEILRHDASVTDRAIAERPVDQWNGPTVPRADGLRNELPAATAITPSGDRRTLLEWTRPIDAPYLGDHGLTGVAANDRTGRRRED